MKPQKIIVVLGLCSLVLAASAEPARAQVVHRIVVDTFIGTPAPGVRELIISELVQQGHQIVPDSNLKAVVSGLGLKRLSENYAAVAQQLGATLFLEGVTSRRRSVYTTRVRMRNAAGPVGDATWSGAGVPRLLAKVRSGLSRRLAAMVAGDGSREPANATAPAALAASPAAGQGAGPVISDSDNGSSAQAMGSAGEVRAAAAQEEDSEQPSSSRSSRLEIVAGPHVFARQFAYARNQVGPQIGYQMVGVPAFHLAADYFFLPFLGISVSGEYSYPFSPAGPDGAPIRTGSFGFAAGPKLRLTFGPADLLVSAAYAEDAFALSKEGSEPPQIANVRYQQIKGGPSARVRISRNLALLAGGSYLHLLSFGEIGSARYFPFVTGYGAEGFAGAAVGLTTSLEVRATANLRRYVLSLNSSTADERQAGAGTDQYLGINLSVAFRD